jgi:bifunctional non-homologous end joining protein LigD
VPRRQTDPLETYRSKRDRARTPEPVPDRAGSRTKRAGEGRKGRKDRKQKAVFVIQEHHARALHWDFRLERDGVLVSWAVPKGLPLDRGPRRLAVQTEDHPFEYATFEGEIPPGEYGAGAVTIWDRGSYDCLKWSDREVMVELHGTRLEGRYVLVRTGDKNWIVQRLDPAADKRSAFPELIRPMLATAGQLPKDDHLWSFEFKWDGIRAIAYVEGGRARFLSRNDRDITASYPDLHHCAEVLGSRDAVLDGEIVAFDASGRPSFGVLQQRMHVLDPAKARRLAGEIPVAYVVFDVMFLEGRSLVDDPYYVRRQTLEGLSLTGPNLTVAPSFVGGGADVLRAARDQGLEGVVAKRLDSPYRPGRRSSDWIKVKLQRTQEVVIVGWVPGQGRRKNAIGALLMALPSAQGLEFVGRVGTGFSDAALDELSRRLEPLARDAAPLGVPVSTAPLAGAHWVEPRLVGEVVYSEWTADGRLRHPSWRGLRPDKDPGSVVREDPARAE